MGWQSCTDKAQLFRCDLGCTGKRIRISVWILRIEDYPEEIRDILIYGTDGKVVKVHYKGQRGEGVYDIAFEGLIQNMEQQIPGDRL